MKTSLLLSLLAAPLLHAGEFNPKTVHSEAAWYLHSDMETLRDTQAGKMAMAIITTEANEVLEAIDTHTGFDVLHDTADVTLYGSGQDKDAILLIRGKFKPKSLLTIINSNSTYETFEHENTTIHGWIDDDSKKQNYASFFEKDTLIISEQKDNVELALDVLHERKKHLELENPIDLKAPLFLGLANIKKINIPKNDDGAKLIKKADSLALGLVEAGKSLKLKTIIKTKNERSAKQLKTVLDGLVALVLLSANEEDQDKATHELTVDGSTVKGELTASLKDIIAMIKEHE